MPRLTPNAAADRSGQSRATIIRAIAAGELAATKHRNRWAIAVEDLDLWTAQRPLTAGRSAEGRFQKGEAPEPSHIPLREPESAADRQKGGLAPNARLEALEALCAALQAEVRELRRAITSLAEKSAPAAPSASVEAEPLPKRRLWPFSAKS